MRKLDAVNQGSIVSVIVNEEVDVFLSRLKLCAGSHPDDVVRAFPGNSKRALAKLYPGISGMSNGTAPRPVHGGRR
jgi:hypothetical protein